MEEKLIEAVQIFPCLYDKSKKEYKNKLLRQKAWMSVAAATGATVEQCQNRWRSLRDRYVKQVASEKPKSGAAAAERSGWRYMDAMSFLKIHVTPRKTLSNMLWEAPEESEEHSTPRKMFSHMQWVEESKEEHNFDFSMEELEPIGSILSGCSENDKDFMPEVEDTARKPSKRQKIDEGHERFDWLCGAVTQLIESKKECKSRNAEFLKVLDGYLLKHSEEEQDRLKIQILNLVFPTIKECTYSMERYTIEQRVKIVEAFYENGCSNQKAFRALRNIFGQNNRPNVSTIGRVVRKFQQTGSVRNVKIPVHARPVRSAELIAVVRDSVAEEPSTSTRRRAQELNISRTSLMRILNTDLNLKADTLTSLVSDEEWVDYKTKFNKTYPDETEDHMRRDLFAKAKVRVEEHNKKYEAGEVSCSMEMNHLTDATEEELS